MPIKSHKVPADPRKIPATKRGAVPPREILRLTKSATPIDAELSNVWVTPIVGGGEVPFDRDQIVE